MPVEKLSIPLYVFVPDRELDFLTDSHVKLDTDCIDTDCTDTDCIDTDCIIADCTTKICIDANFNTCKLHTHRLYNKKIVLFQFI